MRYSQVYSAEEIRKQLKNNGIIYGILEDALEKCSNVDGVKNLLIAKGKEPVDGTDDFLEIRFKTGSIKEFIEDSRGRVNFKSIGFVDYVQKDTVIAVKHKGIDGSDGKDIYGNGVEHKPGKRINLRVGTGCCIKDENEILALIKGEPSFQGNTFCVHKLHEITSDVDIKTGNVKFDGAILINGTVKEDMMVESGDFVEIKKDIEKSRIIAKGNVVVNGNVISSTIVSGGEDTTRIRDSNILLNLKDNILNLINAARQMQKLIRLQNDISYGEIIKLLLENRFKSILKLCTEIINDDEYMSKLFIKKLFNLAPLKIKNSKELLEIIFLIDKNIENIKKFAIIPTNIDIPYCQDSTIESSGSITINGKGEYVSRLVAKDYIIFKNDDSISRGGFIKAEHEVRCGIVGSPSGVSTKISVGRNGHIYVKKAYANTIFVIDNIEYILEVPGKEIHAYLNNNREIVVNKFPLYDN
ncbi:DUF342 domain-containing protein [Clostridium pasteurianum]|uniref:DUF342 domain-containing protein n=1 Tax=Clostridium pasteurianum TaxID=1501 RepID=UPI0003A6F15F|nr:flagellar assembly protein A [Clostridium pasteurianum]